MNVSTTQYFESASGAIFSPCSQYRYALWRRWGQERPIAFVGLNPSTADATNDDPTIRRCIGFARREGAGGLIMLNLYGYRATNPKDLPAHTPTAVGPNNSHISLAWMNLCQLVIAAWGASSPKEELIAVMKAFARDTNGGMYCLGQTKSGEPRHPLYLRSDSKLEVWSGVPNLKVGAL